MVESDNELNDTEKREYNQGKFLMYEPNPHIMGGSVLRGTITIIISPQREKKKL